MRYGMAKTEERFDARVVRTIRLASSTPFRRHRRHGSTASEGGRIWSGVGRANSGLEPVETLEISRSPDARHDVRSSTRSQSEFDARDLVASGQNLSLRTRVRQTDGSDALALPGRRGVHDHVGNRLPAVRAPLKDDLGGLHLPAARLAPDAGEDRKSTRLNSSHIQKSRMPSSA